MSDLHSRVAALDWPAVTESLHARGYAQVPGVLGPAECDRLIAGYDEPKWYRRIVLMERHEYGLGEYKYFAYPLPDLLQTLREMVYPKLAPVANQWMEWLDMERRFPNSLAGLNALCRESRQTQPAVLILKYGEGGYNALHQDLYGEVFFPMQLVLMLNEPGRDYTGGEFVLTQRARGAQSKAMVLRPRRGDMILFTTNFRPLPGARGFRRAAMHHGVSEVRTGRRHTVGILFHDALS